MENLSRWLALVSVKMQLSQRLSEDGTARRYALGGCAERYWRTIRVSSMSHGLPMKHISAWMVTLTSKMSDSGPMEIRGLTVARPVPPAGVTALSRVGIFDPALTEG
jgi:hypothetical protein